MEKGKKDSPRFMRADPLYHETVGIGFPPIASHITSISDPSSFAESFVEFVMEMPSVPNIRTDAGFTRTKKIQPIELF